MKKRFITIFSIWNLAIAKLSGSVLFANYEELYADFLK